MRLAPLKKKKILISFSADSLNTFHRPADSLKSFPYSPRIRFLSRESAYYLFFYFFLSLLKLSGGVQGDFSPFEHLGTILINRAWNECQV